MTLVVNANEPGQAHDAAFCAWLREHGVAPENTFRVVIGPEYMVVHQYATDEKGRKFIDPDTQSVALKEMFQVGLRSPVPPYHGPPSPSDLLEGGAEAH